MDKSERAKIFAPFDALKGFREALRERERIYEYEPKKDLGEDLEELLDRAVRTVHSGDMVCIKYYDQGEYTECTGELSEIDLDSRVLQIINTSIPFDSISDIRREG